MTRPDEPEEVRRATARPVSVTTLLVLFGVGTLLITMIATLVPFYLTNEITKNLERKELAVAKREIEVAKYARENRDNVCRLYHQWIEQKGGEKIEGFENFCQGRGVQK